VPPGYATSVIVALHGVGIFAPRKR
jgi:hypothetical protein